MAFSGNNQALYNAALNGALAGQLAGAQQSNTVSSNYAAYGNVATAFATEVDSKITAVANLTSAGASVVQATAAEAATQNAYCSIIFGLSFGFWFSRAGSDVTAADYSAAATAVFAVYTQALAQYALAPGGTSIS
jgi:hypothetical protein